MKRSTRHTTVPAILLAAAIALPACTSSQVLEPSALVGGNGNGAPAQSPAFPPVAPGPGAATGGVAAVVSDARLQFAPVVGAPDAASAPLAARLSVHAGARGISLVGAGDSSATHVMKGYFSAISEGGRTTVIYVWDVTDAAGTRVHRIQGQERAASGGGEGWDGVQPATMEAIADETVERLAAWLTARQG